MRLERLALVLAPAHAWAAPPGGAGMIGVALSLVVILGGFVLVAWLLRRYLPGAGAGRLARVVSVTPVGPRERVVVVEIEDTWLVLGVGGGQVRLLDRRARPADRVRSGGE